MSIDTPFVQLQINLINRLFHEMQWGHTSHSIDTFYDDIKHDLKNPLPSEIIKVIEEVKKSGGINKYLIQGDVEAQSSTTMLFFDIDEEKLSKYLKLLEFQMNINSSSIFKFKYNVLINFSDGTIKHGSKSYNLPISKSGIRLLKLMLTYYPDFVSFRQIDNEFELMKIRKDDSRLADKRIYEIRDDLLNYLIKDVHLSKKIASQFVQNVRGAGYKISLKSDN